MQLDNDWKCKCRRHLETIPKVKGMKLNSKKNVIKYQYSDKCLKTHMGKKKKLQRSKFAWHGSSG